MAIIQEAGIADNWIYEKIAGQLTFEYNDVLFEHHAFCSHFNALH